MSKKNTNKKSGADTYSFLRDVRSETTTHPSIHKEMTTYNILKRRGNKWRIWIDQTTLQYHITLTYKIDPEKDLWLFLGLNEL